MKIRTGFVSNSSSSSFIIGIAKCLPTEGDGGYDDLEVTTLGELIERKAQRWYSGPELKIHQDGSATVSADSFDGTEVSVKFTAEEVADPYNHAILYLSGTGDEPEYDEDCEEYNYDDVDESWFSDEQIKAADRIGDLEGHWSYGAGRNG